MAVIEMSHRDAARQVRTDLAAAFRLFARFDMHEGINNHVTVRVPGTDDRFLMNPGDIHWSEITASDVLEVDGDGRVMAGSGQPVSTAAPIHIPIHRAHPRGGCVAHTHMTWATALAAIEGGRLAMCHQNSLRFHEDVAYDDNFHGLAENAEEGRRMAAVQGDKTVLFLANHGVVAVADTVAEAFHQLYYLERCCKVQILAMSTGKPLKLPSEDVCRRAKGFFDQGTKDSAARHFAALKHLLDREGADYAA